MNYLAHTYLSFSETDLLAGNFMADFCTPNDLKNLPASIRRGVDLHRAIDAFTDSHELVKESVRLVRPSQRKYSPVVIDILYDYFLSQHWHLHHSDNLISFATSTYSLLQNRQDVFPEKLRQLFPRMMNDHFLLSCENITRLERTFQRLSARASFENRLHLGHVDLLEHYDTLETHFLAFFPELTAYVSGLYFTEMPEQ